MARFIPEYGYKLGQRQKSKSKVTDDIEGMFFCTIRNGDYIHTI